MAWVTNKNGALGVPTFDLKGVDTVAKIPVGSRVEGFDAVLGTGKFIYLQTSVAISGGDTVVFNTRAATTVKTLSGTHLNSGRTIAVAMTDIASGSFGWFQVEGVAVAKALAAAADGKVFISATAGALSNGVIASCQIEGATFETALDTPVVGFAYVSLTAPSIQPQLT